MNNSLSSSRTIPFRCCNQHNGNLNDRLAMEVASPAPKNSSRRHVDSPETLGQRQRLRLLSRRPDQTFQRFPNGFIVVYDKIARTTQTAGPQEEWWDSSANLSQLLCTLPGQILVHFLGVFYEFADQFFGCLIRFLFRLSPPIDRFRPPPAPHKGIASGANNIAHTTTFCSFFLPHVSPFTPT